MNLTSGAAPIFFTKNYVNRDVLDAKVPGIFTASSMQEIADRILEMDPYSIWQGSTADDTVTEILDIALYEGDAQALRELGFLALVNINFKGFTVSLSDDNGVTFHTVYTETAHAAAYWLKDLSAGKKNVNFLRIAATTTQTANDYKMLGTVIAADLLLQLTTPPSTIEPQDVENSVINTMADGSKDVTLMKHSATSFTFYGASFRHSNVAETEMDDLKAVRRENPVFLFYPEPGDKQMEIYFCRFNGAIKYPYSSAFKGAGRNLSYAIEEIA